MTVREAVLQFVTDLVRVTLIVRDGVLVTHRLVVANIEAGIVVRGVKVRDKLTVLDGVPVTHLERVLAKEDGLVDELLVILSVRLRVTLLVTVSETLLVTDRVILTDFVGVARIVMSVREGVWQLVTDLVRVMLIERDGVPVAVRSMVVGKPDELLVMLCVMLRVRLIV